jgi:hypothetical protein
MKKLNNTTQNILNTKQTIHKTKKTLHQFKINLGIKKLLTLKCVDFKILSTNNTQNKEHQKNNDN